MNAVYYNGKIIPPDEVIISSSNRSFKYGDGLFETINVINQVPLYIDLHINRLLGGLLALEINIPENWNELFFKETITGLCKINKLQNARSRITIWRDGEGFYQPKINDAAILMEVSAQESKEYILNENGVRLGVFTNLTKTANILSPYKTANSLVYVLAAKYAVEQNFDDVVVLNDAGRIADSINSSVFVWRQSVLFTPSIKEGGVDGVMKQVIIDLCRKEEIPVNEGELPLEMLLQADEIFLSNVMHGIKWVGSYQKKNYANTFSKDLLYIINETNSNNSLVSP